MEKINLSHEIDSDSFLSQLLLDAMTRYCDKHNIELEDAFNLEKNGAGCLLNARLTIGNIELDLKSFVASLEEEHEELLIKKAKQLIANKVKSAKLLLDRVESQMATALDTTVEVIGEGNEG